MSTDGGKRPSDPDPIGCATPGRAAAHAAVLRRMVAEAPPFRPDATPRELVEEFAHGEHRMAAYLALYARGDEVLPAVREGFGHPDWQVRRWCAFFADTVADRETLRALVPLVNDPKSQVRLGAVHSIACESCKDGTNPVDAVPLLLERIDRDDSVRVRRQAVAMLAHHRTPDPRVIPVFERILAETDDRKLRLHAGHGLKRYARAGLLERHRSAASGPSPRPALESGRAKAQKPRPDAIATYCRPPTM